MNIKEKLKVFIKRMKAIVSLIKIFVVDKFKWVKPLVQSGIKSEKIQTLLSKTKKYFHGLKEKFHHLPKFLKIALVSMPIAAMLFIGVAYHQSTQYQQQNAQDTLMQDSLDRLNTLQSDVNQLMDAFKKSKGSQETLAATLMTLQEKFNALQSQAGTLPDNVNDELNTILKELEALKQLNDVVVLPPSALPFEVISIDFWNGVPLVTVKMNHHTELMGLMETRAGWQWVEMNIHTKELTFKNKQDKSVYVQL